MRRQTYWDKENNTIWE